MMRVLLITIFLGNFSFATGLGETLFEGNCTTCHHRTKSISAPSAAQIQSVYKANFKTKEAFVNFMSSWIVNPNPSTALMSEAIEQFQIMPSNLGYDDFTLKAIAEFLYEVDIKE
jgi:cytochrome c551/c552